MFAVTGITGKVGGAVAENLLEAGLPVRATREALLRSQGMKNPAPRMRMVDGFNEGWIDFERNGEHRTGSVPLEAVIAGLIGKGTKQ